MVEDGEIVVNKWSPDTCGCVLNYSWIRGSSENGRVHTYEGHDRKCHDHGDLMEQHLYNTVVEENQRKNITLNHAVNIHRVKLAEAIKKGDVNGTRWRITENGRMVNGSGNEEPIDESNVIFVLRQDVNYTWFFTGVAPNRMLNVTFSVPLEKHEKDMIESRFPGNIKVQG